MKFKQKDLSKNIDEVKSFANQIGVSNTMAQILMQRGIDSKEKFFEYTNPSLQNFRDPFLLDGMKECKERIEKAIQNNEKILIYGDYDVDGITAASIMHRFLKDKVSNIDIFLPNRYEDGYGLTMDSAKKVLEEYSPNLVITVDCGISCADEIEYIKSQGVDVIVTDHHEIPENLPKTIVVDPKLPNQSYGFDGLCGAGVAMKVVETFVGRENLNEYLSVCAIATVSDIVPLVDENRAIVKLGLELQEYLPQGIKMLLKQLKIDKLTSQGISFKLAPRLNATGRMGNAYYSLNAYISNDEQILDSSLKMIDELNSQRQQLSQQIFDDCMVEISAKKLHTQKAIIIENSNWDSGLLGIACARLVDEFNKPVFLFSNVEGVLKGSVRSIDGINIHSVLSSCKSFLDTFGGHSMAAGLSLKQEFFEKFKSQIFEYLETYTSNEIYEPIKYYDAKVEPENINLKFAEELEILEPVGCDNPNPIFMIEYSDAKCSKMQNFTSHLNLTIKNTLKLVAFNSEKDMCNYQYANKKQTLFEVQINQFKGKQTVKGIVKKSLFYGVSETFQNISSGKLLKQLYGKKFYGDIEFFESNQTENLLETLLNIPTGTAIIVYKQSTYEEYKNLLEKFNLCNFICENLSKIDENCLIFGLNDIKSIVSYKNLIFLDTLLDTNFLSGFSGKIYSIKNQPCKVEKIFMSRDNFGIIYKAFVSAIKSNFPYANEIEFYELVKSINPHLFKLSYSQYVACLLTFMELGMIKLNIEYGYLFYVDETVKSKLENSDFYNRLNFISMISKW